MDVSNSSDLVLHKIRDYIISVRRRFGRKNERQRTCTKSFEAVYFKRHKFITISAVKTKNRIEHVAQ